MERSSRGMSKRGRGSSGTSKTPRGGARREEDEEDEEDDLEIYFY